MTFLRITIRAAALIFLLVAGVRVALLAVHAGNPALALVAGLACLFGCIFVVARSSEKLALCGFTGLLGLGLIGFVYFVVLPLVIFKVDARAFPGHMVVEFGAGCPDSTRGVFRRRIEYVVWASGYGCSSTHLPEYFRLSLVFYDGDPNVTREPPPLAEGTVFATGALNCDGSARPYAVKVLAAPGGPRETWYDFVERVNFRCGIEPPNIAVQRTGARGARHGPLTTRVSAVRAADGDDDVNLDDEGTQNGGQGG